MRWVVVGGRERECVAAAVAVAYLALLLLVRKQLVSRQVVVLDEHAE